MSEQNKTLVPQLRFPEFQDVGAWENKPIGEVTQVTAGATPSTNNPSYWGGDIPWMNSGELNLKRVYGVSNRITALGLKETSTKPIPPGCILIGLAGQGKTRGTAAINYIELCTNQSIATILPNIYKFVSEFLFHKLDSMYSYLRSLSKGEGGRGGLNIQIIKSVEIPFPDLEEQQKIADCLSSIDELIATHTQKHEALKAHKKGLMQQLFPAEGKTVVPSLRFPEFRDAGAWDEKQLGQVAVFSKGKGVSKSDVTTDGKQPCIRYGELYTLYNETIESVSSYTNLPADDLVLSEASDVIIPASGETQEDIAKASCVINSGVALGGDVNVIRSKMNGVFLAYYLNGAKKKSITQLAQGISVIHLYSSQLKKLDITIPEFPEQQKIADCLSSIDNIIAEYTQKIEALKAHKKGLLQQLFPTV